MKAHHMVAIGALAGGVAHEVNNPLAYLNANLRFSLEQLDALAKGVPAAAPAVAEIVEALQEALEGAQRVRQVVQALEGRTGPPERHPIDVHRVLDAMLRLLAARREFLVFDRQPVPRVWADEGQLSHALFTLIDAMLPHSGGVPLRITTQRRGDDVAVTLESASPRETQRRALLALPGVLPATDLMVTSARYLISSFGGRLEVSELPGGTWAAVVLLVAVPGEAVAP